MNFANTGLFFLVFISLLYPDQTEQRCVDASSGIHTVTECWPAAVAAAFRQTGGGCVTQ